MLSNEITSLAVKAGIEVFDGFDIREFLLSAGSLDPMIDDMETWATNLVPVDDSQRRFAAAKLKKASTSLDKLRKEVVTELKEEPKTIDANVRDARKRIDAIEAKLMRPILEKEARADKLRIFADRPNILTSAPLAQLREELATAKAFDTGPSIWLEKAAEAHLVKAVVVEALEAMIVMKELDEADKAELEAFRRQTELDKARKEGEEKARRELAENARTETIRTVNIVKNIDTYNDLCAIIRKSKGVGELADSIIQSVKNGQIRGLTFGG